MEKPSGKRQSFARFGFGPLLACLGIFLFSGCEMPGKISRDELMERMPLTMKYRYQTTVTCRSINNTLWVYLPYASGRAGEAGTDKNGTDALHLQYRIASFNPFRIQSPPELKHMIQKTVRTIRNFELACREPHTFFVLVVTDIENPLNRMDEYYMGYYDDLKNHRVGVDFSGEGYSRLTWDRAQVGVKAGDEENKAALSYQDIKGEHVNYHELTMREFVEAQIKWRIYKRFTIEYNTVPFDLSDQEKKDAVIDIVKTVVMAYNFNEIATYYLGDVSFLNSKKTYQEHPLAEIKAHRGQGFTRRAAF
jgi:hypothetical protein